MQREFATWGGLYNCPSLNTTENCIAYIWLYIDYIQLYTGPDPEEVGKIPQSGGSSPITYLCIYYLLFILLLFYFLFNGLEKSIKRIMTNKIREKIKFFTLQ